MAFTLDDIYSNPERVVVTAHRGFSGQCPENTLPAFLAAVALGVELIEFDLRGTKDGVPIVLHDATLERTTNQPGGPSDYLLSEIVTFEASYWQGSHENGEKLEAPALPGTRIPTFEAVLQAVSEDLGLNIQVYDAAPPVLAEICRLYRAYDLYPRGYLTMSTYTEARRVREIDPGIELCVLDRQGRMEVAALDRLQAFGCRYVQPLRRDITAAFCTALHERGLRANVFYANTDEVNRELIAMGVRGILTDYPDVLIATRHSVGIR
jgi:glycerophosphoryl diester phosphodiesterase